MTGVVYDFGQKIGSATSQLLLSFLGRLVFSWAAGKGALSMLGGLAWRGWRAMAGPRVEGATVSLMMRDARAKHIRNRGQAICRLLCRDVMNVRCA